MLMNHQKTYMMTFNAEKFFQQNVIRIFWSGTDDNDIARKVLSYIPDDFSGNILDVPVGTAVFTEHKWLPRISR